MPYDMKKIRLCNWFANLRVIRGWNGVVAVKDSRWEELVCGREGRRVDIAHRPTFVAKPLKRAMVIGHTGDAFEVTLHS